MHIADPFEASTERQATPLTEAEILAILGDITGSAMRIHAQVSAPVASTDIPQDLGAKPAKPFQHGL